MLQISSVLTYQIIRIMLFAIVSIAFFNLLGLLYPKLTSFRLKSEINVDMPLMEEVERKAFFDQVIESKNYKNGIVDFYAKVRPVLVKNEFDNSLTELEVIENNLSSSPELGNVDQQILDLYSKYEKARFGTIDKSDFISFMNSVTSMIEGNIILRGKMRRR